MGSGFSVRISETARRSVVFFGAPSPNAAIEYGGTGFMVLFREGNGTSSCYLVTAAHVARRIDPGSDVMLRVNRRDGGSAPFTLHDVVWSIHSDKNVDIAATPGYIDPAIWDLAYLNLNDAVKRDAYEFRVQHGDPISIVGLFRLHSGSNKNTPIVHSGNIALMPDPEEKIPVQDRATGGRLEMEAYLVEAQTLDGLSGAPVFQREIVQLSHFPEHNGGKPIVATGAQLLGVYSGAWEGEPDKTLAENRGLKPNRRVPVGMGIVVPIERLVELIMTDEKLIEHRKIRRERDATEKRAAEAVTDTAFKRDAGDLPSSDANPEH